MAARFGNAVSRGHRITGDDAPLYQAAPVAKGIGMSQLKNGAKAAGFNAKVAGTLAAPQVKAGMKAATSTPKRKMAVAGAGGALGGAAMTGNRQPTPVYVAPYSQQFGKGWGEGNRSVRKLYRQYDPEHRRQRRMGNAEAGLTLGGGYAVHRGARGVQRETRELRDTKIQDRPTKPMTSVERKFGRKAIAVSRRNGALVAGGLGAFAAAGGVARHANNNKGRTYR